MDVESFRNSPTGDIVPISGTDDEGRWEHFAFLPHPLTERSVDLDASCYLQVGEARAALAALDATAARLPNPRLFRHAVLRIEAQSTAALEGTYEPIDRVFGNDADVDHDPSLREVLNYVGIAEDAFTWAEQGRRWTPSALSELHRRLMFGTKHERDFFGVRPIQVVVGRRPGANDADPRAVQATYVPPPPGPGLHERLHDLLDWMQTPHHNIDPVVGAAMGHYAFEATHPFHDGNGRIGRLLIVLQLHAAGVLTEPTISVSSWFERRRQDYYDALLAVSTVGDWSNWVGFFAEGLAKSARDATKRMLDLAEVQAALKEQVQQSSIRTANALLLIDFAVARPTFTINQAADAIGLKYQGTSKLVNALVELGVLRVYGDSNYSRRFYSPAVHRVLLGQNRARRH